MSDRTMLDGKQGDVSDAAAEEAATKDEKLRDMQAEDVRAEGTPAKDRSLEDMQASGFDALKLRLDEIVEAVEDENLPLEDALGLYEEAVKLGLQASSLLEEAIIPKEDLEDTEDANSEPAETPAETDEGTFGEGFGTAEKASDGNPAGKASQG